MLDITGRINANTDFFSDAAIFALRTSLSKFQVESRQYMNAETLMKGCCRSIADRLLMSNEIPHRDENIALHPV